MEKKIWSTPVATVEQFMADEYVSACWSVACDLGAAGGASGSQDPIPQEWWGGVYDNDHKKEHGGSGCGWAENQYVQDVGENTFQITEVNLSSDAAQGGQTSLLATIFGVTDADADYDSSIWNNQGSSTFTLTDEQMKNGVKIYWTTTAKWSVGTAIFHHFGIVNLFDSARAKHS